MQIYINVLTTFTFEIVDVNVQRGEQFIPFNELDYFSSLKRHGQKYSKPRSLKAILNLIKIMKLQTSWN